jgi:hypothetical protein
LLLFGTEVGDLVGEFVGGDDATPGALVEVIHIFLVEFIYIFIYIYFYMEI